MDSSSSSSQNMKNTDNFLLKFDPIHYLDVDNLRRFATATLISKTGDKVQVNPLVLAAFNGPLIKNLSIDEDDQTIITEFAKDELEMVVDFCQAGVLPVPLGKLQQGVPSQIKLVFEGFGIYLQRVLFEPWQFPDLTPMVVIKPENFPVLSSNAQDDSGLVDHQQIKTENLDLEDYYGEHTFIEADDFIADDADEIPIFDNDLDLETKIVKRKRGRPKKSEEDKDWSAAKPKSPKKKRVKKEVTSENDNDNADNPTSEASSARKEMVPVRSKITLIRHCRKLQEQFNGAINVHLPSEEVADMKLFDTYKLPNPAESYLRPPRAQHKIESFVEDQTKPYPCELCVKRFTTKLAHTEHLAKHHFDHYDCPFCNKAFPVDDPEWFRKHMFRHEHVTKTTVPHECVQCGFSSFRKESLSNHITGAGSYHDNQCAQCTERFKTYQEHKSHIEAAHAGKWLFKCGVCAKLFDVKEDITKHRSKDHRVHVDRIRAITRKVPKATKVCDICGKAIKYGLDRHMWMKHDNINENVPCPECGKTFRKQELLSAHIKGVHEKIPCTICGVMVAKKRRGRHHQQYHTSDLEKRHKCDICGKGFIDNARLSDHLNTHTGAKPYVCKFCGNTFASKGNHRMHERGHMGHRRSK
jgi:uncharacterized C2H2 Zn-finger protein